MTTLAADTPRVYGADYDPHFTDIPMIASDTIYEGAAVGVVAASGHARPFEDGDLFAGFAESQATNGATAAATTVKVRQQGLIKDLAIAGTVVITDTFDLVYATDDNTFSVTDSGSDVGIGWIQRFVSAGVGDLYFRGRGLGPVAA